MSNRLDVDPDLFDLVSRVDPMLDPRVQANAGLDAESALRLLRLELDRPPQPRRADRWRRTALRTAVLACAIAVAVFVVANVAGTGNGSGVSPAQAKVILRHLRAALVFPPNAIYEEQSVGTVTAGNGATHTEAFHEWLLSSSPYNGRIIVSEDGKVQWEQAFVNGRLNLYDPTTNTVYLAPGVAANQVSGTPQSTSALSEVEELLNQSPSKVKINRNAVLDGKSAIELTFDDGRFSYWISPTTYQPLQSEDRHDSLPDGQSGVGITRYPIVRVLTGSAASPSLLSLQVQHPGATVDPSPTDYAAALSRLRHVTPSITPPATGPQSTTTTTPATTTP